MKPSQYNETFKVFATLKEAFITIRNTANPLIRIAALPYGISLIAILIAYFRIGPRLALLNLNINSINASNINQIQFEVSKAIGTEGLLTFILVYICILLFSALWIRHLIMPSASPRHGLIFRFGKTEMQYIGRTFLVTILSYLATVPISLLSNAIPGAYILFLILSLGLQTYVFIRLLHYQISATLGTPIAFKTAWQKSKPWAPKGSICLMLILILSAFFLSFSFIPVLVMAGSLPLTACLLGFSIYFLISVLQATIYAIFYQKTLKPRIQKGLI